jgi:hypothetical protein
MRSNQKPGSFVKGRISTENQVLKFNNHMWFYRKRVAQHPTIEVAGNKQQLPHLSQKKGYKNVITDNYEGAGELFKHQIEEIYFHF